MNLIRLFVIAFLAATVGVAAAEPGTQPAEPPADFLKVESKAWTSWLDEPTNTSWKRIPLNYVMNEAFGAASIAVEPAKTLETPITLDAVKLSRRTALWRLSQQYGFTVRWEQRNEPRMFMDLLESEEQRTPVNGSMVVLKTHVMRAQYSEYLELKQAGRVKAEEMQGDTIYFATKVHRHVPFDHISAMVTVTERYKTTIPKTLP